MGRDDDEDRRRCDACGHYRARPGLFAIGLNPPFALGGNFTGCCVKYGPGVYPCAAIQHAAAVCGWPPVRAEDDCEEWESAVP